MRAPVLLCALLAACSTSVLVLEPASHDGGAPAEQDASLPPPPDEDAGFSADGGVTFPLTGLSFGAAFDHTCTSASGVAMCFGRNDSAQLGLGDTSQRLTVSRVPVPGRTLSTCAGETHSCALTDENQLYCWGTNARGQLGLGDLTSRDEPTAVPAESFTLVACGGANTCGIRGDGALYCWGENFEGKIGQDDPFTGDEWVTTPTRVAPELAFRAVSVGQGHVCAIDSMGALYCWGRNINGQLGLDMDVAQVRKPTRVGTREYLDVSAGQHHTCAVRMDNTLECWGTDTEGALGMGPVPPETVVRVPTPVSGDHNYRKVSINWFHGCALRTDDTLWCWGRNAEGQLGLGDNAARNTPTQVGTAPFRELSAGHFHSCAWRDNGLYCWGENNEYGQLGLGEVGRKNTPTMVPIP